jgi:protein O-mannosyl-transferase
MAWKVLLRSIATRKNKGTRYGFLLGAGASVSSGIPDAKVLANRWLVEIKEDDPDGYKELTENTKYKKGDIAALYSKIYEKRFQELEDGYLAIEEIMKEKKVWPSIGYPILAEVMNKTRHNLMLTTNFDRLTETALLIYQNVHARVIAHENMIDLIPIDDQNPFIAKVHGDMYCVPNSKELENLREWPDFFKEVISQYHLIVIGYGGNDGGVMKSLNKGLEENSKAKLYWCHIDKELGELQEFSKQAMSQVVSVEIPSFDTMMLMLGINLGYSPNSEEFIDDAKKRQQVYDAEIAKLVSQASTGDDEDVADAITKLVARTWWEVELSVRKTQDLDEKESLYLVGIEKFSESHELLGNYALFLEDIRKDYDGAERHYKKALKINSDHANLNCNYATFLKGIRKDYDEAEWHFKKALETDPDHGNTNVNYAIFLSDIRKDYDGSEQHYRKALEIDLDHADYNCNYAYFLNNTRKDYDEAERYYKKALNINPDSANNNGNYAGFLLARGRTTEAKPFLEFAEKNTDRKDLKLELHFYRLAHFPKTAKASRKAIKKLLEEGVRSPGWDFSGNIEQAEKEGCTYVKELRELAEKISTVE